MQELVVEAPLCGGEVSASSNGADAAGTPDESWSCEEDFDVLLEQRSREPVSLLKSNLRPPSGHEVFSVDGLKPAQRENFGPQATGEPVTGSRTAAGFSMNVRTDNNPNDLVLRMRIYNGIIVPPCMPWEVSSSAAVFDPAVLSARVTPRYCEGTLVGFRDHLQGRELQVEDLRAADKSTLPGAAKRVRLSRSSVESEVIKAKAFDLLKTMLAYDYSATLLGGMLLQASPDQQAMSLVLEDTFRRKASSTVYKRVRAYWRYYCWARQERGMEKQALVPSEESLYRYLSAMRESGRGATSGESFVQSVNFLHAMVTFVHYQPASLSNRVKGVAFDMFCKKQPLCQARQLSVPEVRRLENMVISPLSEAMGVIAGYLMFCMATSCRFGDALFATNFEVIKDEGTVVIRAGTLVHKTSSTKERRTKFLPLMGLGKFMHDDPWAEHWMSLRASANMDQFLPVVMPSYNEMQGRWQRCAMTTAEGSQWLRDMLSVKQQVKGSRLSSHSLKVTLLTWGSLSGLLSQQEQRVMGHHMDPGSTSALTYSRDALSSVLAKTAVIVQHVKAGSFDPDASVAKRVSLAVKGLMEQVDEHDQEWKPPEEDQDVSSSESEVASETLEDPEEIEQQARNTCELVRHQVSGVLHILVEEQGSELLCGRKLGLAYMAVAESESADAPMCRQCSKSWSRVVNV